MRRRKRRSKNLQYRLWREDTYKLLTKTYKIRLQKKSVHKLQKKIAAACNFLNTHGKSYAWTFKKLSQVVLLAISKPCIYCSEIIIWNNWSVDHKIPLQRKGKSTLKNVQIICSRCNRAKGTIGHKPFRRLLASMNKYPRALRELLKRLSFGGSLYISKKR